jgi:hypothetical protein
MLPVPEFMLRKALANHVDNFMIVFSTERPFTLTKLMDIATRLPRAAYSKTYYDLTVYMPDILEVTRVCQLDSENGGAAWKIYTYDTETDEIKGWPLGTKYTAIVDF